MFEQSVHEYAGGDLRTLVAVTLYINYLICQILSILNSISTLLEYEFRV